MTQHDYKTLSGMKDKFAEAERQTGIDKTLIAGNIFFNIVFCSERTLLCVVTARK